MHALLALLKFERSVLHRVLELQEARAIQPGSQEGQEGECQVPERNGCQIILLIPTVVVVLSPAAGAYSGRSGCYKRSTDRVVCSAAAVPIERLEGERLEMLLPTPCAMPP